MPLKIIILQHTPLVTAGYFTNLMSEDLVETTIIRLDKGEHNHLMQLKGPCAPTDHIFAIS